MTEEYFKPIYEKKVRKSMENALNEMEREGAESSGFLGIFRQVFLSDVAIEELTSIFLNDETFHETLKSKNYC
jgi:hypothetical protein